jgi:hypothetical protein
MSTTPDWTAVDAAAQHMAGNWRQFPSFAWSRGYHLDDADHWTIWYTSGRDAGLLEESNHAAITQRLAPFTGGDDPDVVAEQHSHWAVGYLEGFAVRVYGAGGSTTRAFEELCRIKQALAEYPVLNEADYSEREYQATLENYRSQMGDLRNRLPQGWAGDVYSWFSDHGHDRYTQNVDDRGGWAPREQIVAALHDLGMLGAAAGTPG